ncbi:MAG TPA: hypothetical protein VLA40_14375 [Rheinheimera sp.]|nr:hypothetical protein [Rheinheimera sp.]
MANLVTLRDTLATALEAAGRVVYAFPKEQITPPALVLVPSSPYIVPVGIGGLNNRINVRFDLTALVGAADNQAALANLETLMLAVFDSLPAGTSVNNWSQPTVQSVANQELLTSEITIELVTTNNGN